MATDRNGIQITLNREQAKLVMAAVEWLQDGLVAAVDETGAVSQLVNVWSQIYDACAEIGWDDEPSADIEET